MSILSKSSANGWGFPPKVSFQELQSISVQIDILTRFDVIHDTEKIKAEIEMKEEEEEMREKEGSEPNVNRGSKI